jgi:hypothetical protein
MRSIGWRALCALLLAGAIVPGTAAAKTSVHVKLLTATQSELLHNGAVKLRVKASGPLSARLSASVPKAGGKGSQKIAGGTARFSRRGTRTVSLKLSDTGARRADAAAGRAADACGGLRVSVVARAKAAARRRRAGTRRRAPAFTGRSKTARTHRTLSGDPDRRCYEVGAAVRSINPNKDGTYAGKPVFLGGYGIGGGSPVFEGRAATGILGAGPHVRAFAVSDGKHSFAIADEETQGWFVETRNGPYGLLDMRKEVEQRTHGALKAENVTVQSDHTHGGADAIGVWGGVPDEYLDFMKRQTVDAIVEAYEKRRPGKLVYGTAPARDLQSNQFDYDPANKVMDSEVRVLQARDAVDRPFVTLMELSSHATVLGSSNTHITGDWPQVANELLAERFGGRVVTLVGTLGRTQPSDRDCSDKTKKGDAQSLCRLEEYATRVVNRAASAVKDAKPITGKPVVDSRSYLIQDASSNAILLGAVYAGTAIGVPINRAFTPPWLTGNVLGTVTATARIGDVILSSIPGEAYPQIPLKVRELVPARGYMTAGLANDQLGYLIAPYQAYPEPIRRSFFNERGDEVSPIDNDNYFFNVSHTMGERITCSLLRGAGEVMGKGLEYRNAYSGCAPFANDLLMEAGADTD